MNTKHLFRVLIVVLVALALTALAATAQDEPMPTKDMSAISERGESASPAANLNESEPNNSFAAADVINLGDVISGKIGNGNDRDFYKIDVPDEANVLIDIDAEVNGSALDALICLFNDQQDQIACNDDSEGLDSLIYQGLFSIGSGYYIRVQDLSYPYEGGNDYTYTLSVYRPLYLSAAKGGVVAGIRFAPADVLAHYDFPDGTEKWMLFFDASEVGITGNVVGLAVGPYWTEYVLQKTQNLWVEDVYQVVTQFDTLWFETPDSFHYGPSTSGSFFKLYHGAESGLTTASERIDALSYPWVVSTTGAATYSLWPSIRDEDLGELLGLPNFDGSNVAGLAVEDVVGADQDHYAQFGETNYWLTIAGSGVIDGHLVTQKDIFIVDPANHVSGLYWHGPDHHFNYNIDAFDAVD